jgi:hypothetical protein
MWYKQQHPIRTGDLLLFRGDGFSSSLITTACNTEYSHVGLAVVIHLPTRQIVIDNSQDETKVYLFESNKDEEHDYLRNKRGNGCRLVDLDSVAHKYLTISHRSLIPRWSDSWILERTSIFLCRWSGVKFTRNPMIMLAPWIGGTLTGDRLNPQSIFCSELVVRYLTDALELPINNSPWLIGPHHLSQDIDCYQGEPTLLWYRKGNAKGIFLLPLIILCVILLIVYLCSRVSTTNSSL